MPDAASAEPVRDAAEPESHETTSHLTATIGHQRREIQRLAAELQASAHLLDQRTQDLSLLGAEVTRLTMDLQWKPPHSRERVLRWLRHLIRSAGRRVRQSLVPALRVPVRATRGAYASLVPARARAMLEQALSRQLMTWPTYAFDRYKRTRQDLYGTDVGSLRVPVTPGLVSIVLPVYNGEATVHETIDSVLAQRYGAFELIVVDDGSSDDTPAIVEAYARRDRRIRVVRQDNARLPRALSRGFRLATGEFLTWTSADNRLKPAFLEEMVACLGRHPEWDMAYGDLDLIGEHGRLLTGTTIWDGCQLPPGSGHVHLPHVPAELNVVANNHVGATFLYRRRVPYLVGDYSPHRFITEDYDYWMRINALMTLRHADVDEPLTDYRFHDRSLTSRWHEFDMWRRRDRLMVFEDFRRDFYLAPMLWILDGDDGALRRALTAAIARAGHLIYDETYAVDDLPPFGIPIVHACTTADPAAAGNPRPSLPRSAHRVLLTSASVLPDVVPDGWTCCIALGAPSTLPDLRDYRGWMAASDVGTVFQAIDARVKSDSLAEWEQIAESAPRGALDASVVICTVEPSDRLRESIAAVAAQSFDHARYEVIVVANTPAPQAALRQTIDELRAAHFSARPDHLRSLVCPVPGLSAARNAGLAAARGDLVVYLDDDAVAENTWLAELQAIFAARPQVGVVGGHILLRIPTPRPAALRPGWEKYWSHYVTTFTEYTEVEDWRQFPWGASWAARREALLRIGGFRRRYGRRGTDYWGGEELVAALLVRRLGYAVGVHPRAVVHHAVTPARMSFAHVRRTIAAGLLVGYHAQRDLYLPWRPGGPPRAIPALLLSHVDRTVEPGASRWRDALYRKLGQLRLLAAEASDVVRRLRRPTVARRS
ncbi:MAG: glycosyltransferase [Acidobacteria bacterium]|nr:glycosyltransferase [Acidobacteriota bacterium]